MIWSKFRDREMSIGALFWASRRTYLVMLIVFALLALVVYTRAGFLGMAFIAVAYFTALLRDVGYFTRSVRVWPVFRETIDWSKVEALFARDDATPKA